MDMVLRWDGRLRLVDIKLGTPGSAFSASLEHQLRFYAWLWQRPTKVKRFTAWRDGTSRLLSELATSRRTR